MADVLCDERFDYVAGILPIYVGRAAPGTLVSEAKWQIYKMTYDGNNNPTSKIYADGTNGFVKVWDDRDTYSY